MAEKRWVVMLVFVCAVSLLLVSGCGGKKSEDKTVEAKSKDVSVKVDGEKIRVKGENVNAEISKTTSWPADMFPDVPTIGSARVEHVIRTEEAKGVKRFHVQIAGVESDVFNSYTEQLKKGGWQVNTMVTSGEGSMINAQKGNLVLHFMLNTKDKKGILMVANKS
jgi:hypothetical protein